MKNILSFLSIILLTILPIFSHAQNTATKTDTENKLFVVIAVICVLFLGIIAYIFTLEKKIAKLNKKVEDVVK